MVWMKTDKQNANHRLSGQAADQHIVVRWTMSLTSRFLPWQPQLVFSGYSYYTIDAYGKIVRQRDVWDAIQDNSSPSVSHSFTHVEACHMTNQIVDAMTLFVSNNVKSERLACLRTLFHCVHVDGRHCSSYQAINNLPADSQPGKPTLHCPQENKGV